MGPGFQISNIRGMNLQDRKQEFSVDASELNKHDLLIGIARLLKCLNYEGPLRNCIDKDADAIDFISHWWPDPTITDAIITTLKKLH